MSDKLNELFGKTPIFGKEDGSPVLSGETIATGETLVDMDKLFDKININKSSAILEATKNIKRSGAPENRTYISKRAVNTTGGGLEASLRTLVRQEVSAIMDEYHDTLLSEISRMLILKTRENQEKI